ncbi:MAG: hypothetical protein EO766_17390 [Hydrotalea sp. AMD]|uniref:hypothetical protein n=1 Tax=Hydrotalea sp. AMD TaxID=2501297 RepID=UPI0010274621|nr:hypothetical protein [Hydrotalea sp. AMD]RWZ84313.1 MAG: hypothetical protein EO766_17390 [Hydrotalea sp. AMD]
MTWDSVQASTREKEMYMEVVRMEQRLSHMPQRRVVQKEFIPGEQVGNTWTPNGFIQGDRSAEKPQRYICDIEELNLQTGEWRKIADYTVTNPARSKILSEAEVSAKIPSELIGASQNRESIAARLAELKRDLSAYRQLKTQHPRPQSPLMTDVEMQYATFEAKR